MARTEFLGLGQSAVGGSLGGYAVSGIGTTGCFLLDCATYVAAGICAKLLVLLKEPKAGALPSHPPPPPPLYNVKMFIRMLNAHARTCSNRISHFLSPVYCWMNSLRGCCMGGDLLGAVACGAIFWGLLHVGQSFGGCCMWGYLF
jgi:hypothetical protein